MKNILIIQPYGAASIDLKNGGNIEILNPIATIISQNLINRKDYHYTLSEISKVYKIEDRDGVLNDIKEFDENYGYSQNEWEIIGSNDKLSIITTNIELTLKCELSCLYCYTNASPKIDTSKELKKNEWNKVVDWLVKNDVRLVTLTGGNPTLSKSFATIVEKLSKSNIYIRIFTNGIGLDKTQINKIKNPKVIFVEVSLDSMTPNIHNKYRGNSYESAISAIELLAENKFNLGIGTCIYKKNIEELPKLVEFAKTINATLRFGPMTHQGRAKKLKPNEFLSATELNNFNYSIPELYKKYSKIFYDSSENKYMYENGKCDFFYGVITINPQGKLKPCLLSDEFFFKYAPWSISKNNCWEIPNISELNMYLTIKDIDTEYLANKEKCGKCNRFDECSGCLLSGYSCFINSNINN
ncbi:MAG: radical SAM protein [archaeon]